MRVIDLKLTSSWLEQPVTATATIAATKMRERVFMGEILAGLVSGIISIRMDGGDARVGIEFVQKNSRFGAKCPRRAKNTDRLGLHTVIWTVTALDPLGALLIAGYFARA